MADAKWANQDELADRKGLNGAFVIGSAVLILAAGVLIVGIFSAVSGDARSDVDSAADETQSEIDSQKSELQDYLTNLIESGLELGPPSGFGGGGNDDTSYSGSFDCST